MRNALALLALALLACPAPVEPVEPAEPTPEPTPLPEFELEAAELSCLERALGFTGRRNWTGSPSHEADAQLTAMCGEPERVSVSAPPESHPSWPCEGGTITSTWTCAEGEATEVRETTTCRPEEDAGYSGLARTVHHELSSPFGMASYDSESSSGGGDWSWSSSGSASWSLDWTAPIVVPSSFLPAGLLRIALEASSGSRAQGSDDRAEDTDEYTWTSAGTAAFDDGCEATWDVDFAEFVGDFEVDEGCDREPVGGRIDLLVGGVESAYTFDGPCDGCVELVRAGAQGQYCGPPFAEP